MIIGELIRKGNLEELFEVETAAPILALERRVIGHHPRFQPAIAGSHAFEFGAEFAGAAHTCEPRVGEVRDLVRVRQSRGDDDGTLSSLEVA